MKIIDNVTGTTSISAKPITKSAGTLIFATTKKFSELTTETITIVVQRPNHENVQIANKVSLQSVLLLAMMNQNDILLGENGTKKTIGIIELGLESGVLISTGDKIEITIDGATAAATYDLSVTEEFENSTAYVDYETKGIADYQTEETLDVSQYTACVLKIPAELTEIGLIAHGQELKYTPWELRNLALQEMPFINPIVGGAEGSLPLDKLLLPLVGIDQIKVYKAVGGTLTILFSDIKELDGKLTNTVIKTGGLVSTPVRSGTQVVRAGAFSTRALDAPLLTNQVLRR